VPNGRGDFRGERKLAAVADRRSETRFAVEAWTILSVAKTNVTSARWTTADDVDDVDYMSGWWAGTRASDKSQNRHEKAHF